MSSGATARRDPAPGSERPRKPAPERGGPWGGLRVPSLPIGTVTFLFTDIEGSTHLLQHLGDEGYAQALAAHSRLLRNVFAAYSGHELQDHGDGFLVVFPTTHDAVQAAVAAQQAISVHPWPEGVSVQVRIGLHSGAPIGTGDAYVGLDVHRAARICQAGHGGQILLSEATQAQVGDGSLDCIVLRDLGSHRLKDLLRPEKIYQVLHTDLPADFPPLRSLDRFSHNLPVQLTSFIGREREIAEVRRLLAETRLATLTGAGGSGKTRLALQVAVDVVEEYADGVWLVELAAVADPALVPQTVATALRVREQPGRAIIETVADHLHARRLLLLLDNCEHLVEASASLAETLLQRCRGLRILATSREPLAIRGEVVWYVPSLELPDPGHGLSANTIAQSEAVRLFVDRAAAVRAGFALTDRIALPVAQICRQLDGMPLAIELAAARADVLSPEEIAARLGDRFRLLTGGSRTALPRQQTLRAAMEWSYNLLSDKERMLLARFSVFAGGFTFEAAEAVTACGAIDAPDVLDLLTGLVRKSLVIVQTHDGPSRYGMLETVRQYANDRLEESGEAPPVRTRHLDWFQALVERALPQLEKAEEGVWLERLGGEIDNLRAALDWSRTGQGLVERGLWLAGALWDFWFVRGHMGEGCAWLEDLLKRTSGVATSARARALYVAANLACTLGDADAATRYAQDALRLAQALGDRESEGWEPGHVVFGYSHDSGPWRTGPGAG